MILNFDDQGVYTVNLPNVSPAEYTAIRDYFAPLILNPAMKARDAIDAAFSYALTLCPGENPSDLWHHVIYRLYLQFKKGINAPQSWVRASGEAFESMIARLYNPLITEHGLRLTASFNAPEKAAFLRRMEIADVVGGSKVDVILEQRGKGKNPTPDGYGVIGGLHCKASLAERVSDDIPASRHMMARGLLSLLVTLDVKSFPPPRGDLVNRGELGTPARPSDKRRYIEEHGDFNACFSYNYRTAASPGTTASGRRICVVNLHNQPDDFVQYLAAVTR